MTSDASLDAPLTEGEWSMVKFARAAEIDYGEGIRRLSSPVVQDPKTQRWVRKPKGFDIPKGWRVVG